MLGSTVGRVEILPVSWRSPAMLGGDLPKKLVEAAPAAAVGKGAVRRDEHAARVPASLCEANSGRGLAAHVAPDCPSRRPVDRATFVHVVGQGMKQRACENFNPAT